MPIPIVTMTTMETAAWSRWWLPHVGTIGASSSKKQQTVVQLSRADGTHERENGIELNTNKITCSYKYVINIK